MPLVLAGLFGGTFIDRLGYKRTSILSDLASGLTIALIHCFTTTLSTASIPTMKQMNRKAAKEYV